MYEEIDKAAKLLKDTKAGWVTRRDAVELLGQSAARALKVLREHLDEPDVDVHRSVVEAMGKASAAVAGIAPVAEARQYSLDELARRVREAKRARGLQGRRNLSSRGQAEEGPPTDRVSVPVQAKRRGSVDPGIQLLRRSR